MKSNKKSLIVGLLIASISLTALGCGEKAPEERAVENQQPGGNATEPTR